MSPPPIDVDPDLYAAASAVFGQDMAGGLGRAWSALTGGLQGCAGMAGSDPGGTAWSAQYDPAAAATVGVITDLANACTRIAALLEQTGFNHGRAESASDPTRTAPTPPDRTSYQLPANTSGMVCVPGHTVPLAAGGSGSAPHGWGLVEHAVGYVWPNGDPGKLRKAAGAWSRAATALDSVSSSVPEALESIRAQHSPEVDDAVRVCSSMGEHISAVAGQCRSLSNACTQLAGHIDTAHHDIEHELISLVEWTAGIEAAGAVVGFFTLGAGEAGAQAAEAGRIAATAARIAEIIRTLVTAARTVAETVGGVVGRIGGIAGRLRPILGARLSQVATELAARLPRLGKNAESAAMTDLETAAIPRYDFTTAPDEAWFWSGRTDGVGGAEVAGERAAGGGGTTLEQLMEDRGITLPEWDPDDPAVVKAWNEASEEYAKNAKGTVHAVIGENLRPGSVWETSELPALKANPDVTTIIRVDPKTGIEKVIWRR